MFSLSYGYAQNGGNNGQITSITDNVDNGRSVAYGYDALYRLSTALTTGSANYPQWGLSWTYDRYGNRTAQTVTVGSGPSNAVNVSATTNRLTDPGYAYDANGNMIADGLNSLTYDGENRLVTSSGSTYSYDGKNLRVQKSASGTTTVYIFSGSKVIAEYANGAAVGSPTREYIYSAGQLAAKIEGSATNCYHQDHLSARITTDTSGNVIGQQGHYPYGESWYAASTTTKWQFTTYERDAESGNDYAMFRHYLNRLGRFSSADPRTGKTGNPQSLNRYSYVRNDPIGSVDPLGLVRLPLGRTADEDDLFYLTGGWGPGCQADGVDVPCGLAYAMVRSDAGVRCPNNDCALGTSTPFQCVSSACGYFTLEYTSTHKHEWNGLLYSHDEWATFLQDRVEGQREALADAISWASDDPKVDWDYAYRNLAYSGKTQGGNATFSWGDAGAPLSDLSFIPGYATGGCPWSCRVGSMPSIHMNNSMVHLDTANPLWGFGLGFFIHGVVDLVSGNINPSIPMGH